MLCTSELKFKLKFKLKFQKNKPKMIFGDYFEEIQDLTAP